MTDAVKQLGLVGLSHVSLNTGDLAKAEHFYVEVLGGTKVFDLANAAGVRYGTFLSMGNGTFIELFNRPEAAPAGAGATYRHICLQVRSVKDAAAWLGKFGYAPQIKVGRVDKVPQFFITGPDGVEIEFHEYGEGTPQWDFVNHER